MKHRDFRIFESKTLQAALVDAFEYAYKLGRNDGLDGIHLDAKMLAEMYLEDTRPELNNDISQNNPSQLTYTFVASN